GSSSRNQYSALASAFSATFCRAAWPTSSAPILPTIKRFREEYLVLWAARQSRREYPTARWAQPLPQIRFLLQDFSRASSPAHLRRLIPQLAFHQLLSRQSRMADSTRRTSWSGAWGWNINSERQPACRRNMWAHAL